MVMGGAASLEDVYHWGGLASLPVYFLFSPCG